MRVADIKAIADSQFTWEILFIILFLIVVGFLVKTSERREQKLMEFHENSKHDSNLREEKLMDLLQKSTHELGIIAQEIQAIQREMGNISERIDNIERK